MLAGASNMPPAILGVAQCMNVRARARLVNDPDSALSRSLPRHMHAHGAFLSRMHRARTARRPASGIDVGRGPCRHVAPGRARERPGDGTRRGVGRKGRDGTSEELPWLEKALMKVACCLHKSPRQRRKSLSRHPGLSPSFPFSRRAFFHVVTGANGAVGLSALIRGEAFAVKRAYD